MTVLKFALDYFKVSILHPFSHLCFFFLLSRTLTNEHSKKETKPMNLPENSIFLKSLLDFSFVIKLVLLGRKQTRSSQSFATKTL